MNTTEELAQKRENAIRNANLLARKSNNIHYVVEQYQQVQIIPYTAFRPAEWKNCLVWVAFPPRHR